MSQRPEIFGLVDKVEHAAITNARRLEGDHLEQLDGVDRISVFFEAGATLKVEPHSLFASCFSEIVSIRRHEWSSGVTMQKSWFVYLNALEGSRQKKIPLLQDQYGYDLVGGNAMVVFPGEGSPRVCVANDFHNGNWMARAEEVSDELAIDISDTLEDLTPFSAFVNGVFSRLYSKKDIR